MREYTTFDLIKELCPDYHLGQIEKPIKIKSYASYCKGKGKKTWYDYCNYVQSMKQKYDYIPNQKDIFDIIIKHCYSLEYELRQVKNNNGEDVTRWINEYLKMREYYDFYQKFKKYLKSKIATKLNLPVSDITDGLFQLELKRIEIIQKHNL